MSTAPKIFLTLSVTAFALSFAPVFTDFGWGALRPLGAVAFIVFFVMQVLAKEMALYDAEESQKLGHLAKSGHATAPQSNRDAALSELRLAK